MPWRAAAEKHLVDVHKVASEATELIVVRHGETVWNAAGRQQGFLDSPLNAVGISQAEAIAQRLAGESYDALYSSDLGRAYTTAERIAARIGHQIRPEPRLREMNLGIFQGLTLAEAASKFPEAHAEFTAGDPDYVIPRGESVRQRHQRHVAACCDIAARHPGGRVLIVAHGGVLSSLIRYTLNIPIAAPRRFKLFNASINTFFVEHGTWMLGTWGDISHLAAIGSQDDS